jgi:hypothetical protein
MICMRHQQPNLWETFFGDEVAELWEAWMRAVDELLEDDVILDAVYEATEDGIPTAEPGDGIRHRPKSCCVC